MELFDFLDNLFTKEIDVTSKENQFGNYYIVVRFLSMHVETFWLAVDVNDLANKIPKWAVGCWLYQQVPKKKRAPRIYYIKKPDSKKDTSGSAVGKTLYLLARHFCCSEQHAEQIMRLLGMQNINAAEYFGVKGG